MEVIYNKMYNVTRLTEGYTIQQISQIE